MESLGAFEQLKRSWFRHLRAENKSPRTLDTYGEAVGQFTEHLGHEGVTEVGAIRAADVESFICDLLVRHSPATANNRFRALQQFFGWLEAERPSTPKRNGATPSSPRPGGGGDGARGRGSPSAVAQKKKGKRSKKGKSKEKK